MSEVNSRKAAIEATLQSFKTVRELMDYFEIDCDQSFLDEFGTELYKRFNGNVILGEPEDWFEFRRALKNAYCRIQRGRLDPHSRSACRGCTTCERR